MHKDQAQKHVERITIEKWREIHTTISDRIRLSLIKLRLGCVLSGIIIIKIFNLIYFFLVLFL